MNYSKVQFIAYRIYTGPGLNPKRYVGLNDEVADLRLRVKLMAEAVHTASGSDIDRDPTVLKVFMAPEFFFRSMWGGYTDLRYFSGEGAGRDPNSIVGALANIVEGDRWNDWLFVFGTTVVTAAPFSLQDYKDPQTGKFAADQLSKFFGKTAVLNIALVQKGGFADEAERTAKAIAVIKEHMSSIDWLDVQNIVLTPEQVAHFPAVGPGSYALEVNTPGQRGGGGYTGGSIFMLDNITYGLEVCLDHAEARLRRARPQSGDFFVQLQLVPSGGMVVDPTSVAALKDGLVFNVDGLSSASAATPAGLRGYHSQLFRVLSVGQPSVLAELDECRRLAALPANGNLQEVKQVFWLPPTNDETSPDVWAPELVIYSPVAIPDPVVAQV